ncbi:sigma-54-dependent Fis family transcriptional regulator [Rhodobacteraceae bacterium NNCM2]|nr:sigma-54-dependent Fis family transcriptional regulator [Coraliihabitans acroporae]
MALNYSDNILLVEDTRSLSMIYSKVLTAAGMKVTCAYNVAESKKAYRKEENRLILLDLMLPDGDGIELLREVRDRDPSAKVIVISAHGSINRAVEAMREGAFDFLVKPFDDRRLMTAVSNAIDSLALEATGERVAAEPNWREDGFEGFIGSSKVMRSIYDMVSNIGRSTATVFITGESGTGKEVCAQAIHSLSTRSKGPFIAMNCGAIPRDLLESEVFGHLKGSFTGAIADKVGAAAAADGGTLFLDEICEMDLALQTKLLRFLQTSTVQPVGATQPIKVDVRIVCATNRDPAAEVKAGRFREDLYYRLHVVPIHLPPLRERGNDVIEIAERILNEIAEEEGKPFRRLSDAAKERLLQHPWPGNVRQLQNVLRHIVVLNDSEYVTGEMVPSDIDASPAPTPAPATTDAPAPESVDGAPAPAATKAAAPAPASSPVIATEETIRTLVGLSLDSLERRFIEATIDECDGSVTRAARLLDVSPSTLYRKREAWAKTV